MDSFLRDPSWEFWGVAVSVVALAVSLIVAWRQARSKRLVYFARSLRIVSIADAVRDKIEILYDGRPVPDVSLIEFGVRNAGDSPIDETDFVKPITFELAPQASVLRVDLLKTKPLSLSVSFEVTEDRRSFLIRPLLLNRGDQIIGTALTAGGGQLAVTGRVRGVSRLEEQQQVTVNFKRLIGPLLASALILSYATITLGGYFKWHVAYMFLLYVGLIAVFFGRQLRNMWRRWPD